ncbi:MAG: hypothetical protein V3V08_05305 [Nannocystaceae bacterium]
MKRLCQLVAAFLVSACFDPQVDAVDAVDAVGNGVPWSSEDVPVGVTPAGQGIELTAIVVDQGVSVKVAESGGGGGVADGSSVGLLKERNALFRLLWTVPPSWRAREIEAHLSVRFPNGEGDRLVQTLRIEADAEMGAIDQSFHWLIPAAFMRPGMRVSALLAEVNGSTAAPADRLPRLPASGYADLAIPEAPHVINLRLVPIAHELAGLDCPEPPDLTPELVALFRDRLFAYNPVQRVEVDVREPFAFTVSAHDFDDLLDALAQLRVTDNAPPDQYYYGLIRSCDGGEMDVGGKAIGIPQDATPDNAWKRTAVGRFHPMSAGGAIETFIHEVGHTQGRRHAPCGDAAGIDGAYPYPDADIGVYGYNLVDGQLKPPDYKDYMGYCGPTWVSDYGWNLVFGRIEELSSWADRGAAARDAKRGILIGSLHPDGTANWWTSPGHVPATQRVSGSSIEFLHPDGSSTRVPALYERRPHGGAANLVAPIPGPFDAVRYRAGGPWQVVDNGDIRRLWTPRSSL